MIRVYWKLTPYLIFFMLALFSLYTFQRGFLAGYNLHGVVGYTVILVLDIVKFVAEYEIFVVNFLAKIFLSLFTVVLVFGSFTMSFIMTSWNSQAIVESNIQEQESISAAAKSRAAALQRRAIRQETLIYQIELLKNQIAKYSQMDKMQWKVDSLNRELGKKTIELEGLDKEVEDTKVETVQKTLPQFVQDLFGTSEPPIKFIMAYIILILELVCFFLIYKIRKMFVKLQEAAKVVPPIVEKPIKPITEIVKEEAIKPAPEKKLIGYEFQSSLLLEYLKKRNINVSILANEMGFPAVKLVEIIKKGVHILTPDEYSLFIAAKVDSKVESLLNKQLKFKEIYE